jgi:hypothetical protein
LVAAVTLTQLFDQDHKLEEIITGTAFGDGWPCRAGQINLE